jgi:cytochrome c biogenesis protein CcdA/thiol-disulfide isomerase/thioredoxin
MAFFLISYLAGVLTIATPCIFPILPFVFARAAEPFRRSALPMLLGLAITFAVVASLPSVAGGWAVAANRDGRTVALAIITLFGLAMLFPALAAGMTMPIVSLGSRLAEWARWRAMTRGREAASSLLLGVATGLVWAPCAGPVLGLILSSAALRGPSLETSLLLFAYGMGAATALAGGMLLGGRLLAVMRRSIRWSSRVRQFAGAAVIAGAATIWTGFDTGPLTRWSASTVSAFEQNLLLEIPKEPALIVTAARAAPAPAFSPPLSSLLSTQQWLNTPPLQLKDLRGKVVVVNFWTYSCINCLRLLPYARAWAEKYRDRGLVVIGVHTPEFAFEKDPANVSKALAALRVTYPIAIDSDFGIWRAFGNEVWPALYFIGADGRIRKRVLGEGGYADSERLIQQLLSEEGGPAQPNDIATIKGDGPQAEADARDLRSAETYIGYGLARGFAAPDGVRQDAPSLYRAIPALPLNRWSLSGIWTIGEEFATLDEGPGRIAYRFHARDLHLVLGPSFTGRPIRFRVKLDGAPPGPDHGADVDAEGWGSVQDGRLYQLIRQTAAVADRTFEIEFYDAGVRAYVFTFG